MSKPRISLDQWRALVAVVDAGSYAKAAEALHKSQSSVTYAVQQIESQLGVKAFVIEGRRAVLTPTGQMLLRRARYLLEEAAGLEQSAQRLSAGWEAELRIAVEVLFPTWLLFASLDRFGQESPATRIEVIESVLGHRIDSILRGPGQDRADLAIFGVVPPGFTGDPLLRMRFVLVAHPDHPLHKLGRKLALRDLRPYRHLVVRESSPERASAPSMETTQRWTVSHLATSIEAARSGYGFAWLPEDKIRDELSAGTLKRLALREGGERYADLYLIFADREHAGPGTLRLAEILRETTVEECRRQASPAGAARRPSPKSANSPGVHRR
jgi:DNA-binding transcriptional LysR family regulator